MSDRSGSPLPIVAVIVVGLAVMVGLVAWSSSVSDEDTAAQSLCANYAGLVDAGEAVRGADPESSSAAEAQALVDEYLDQVHSLQTAADTRYTSQLDALEQSATDVQRTLASVQDDADYATWAPLVADDVEAVLDAAAEVERVVGPSCEPPDL